MRTVNVVLEDKQFEQLEELKGKDTWRTFIDRIIESGYRGGLTETIP